jgi:hypothetical protein
MNEVIKSIVALLDQKITDAEAEIAVLRAAHRVLESRKAAGDFLGGQSFHDLQASPNKVEMVRQHVANLETVRAEMLGRLG